ncbi:MAG: DUF1501 domain-containing protein [Planctomycetaceae bacterium]
MLSIGLPRVRNCEGLTRRALLQLGTVSLPGALCPPLAWWATSQPVLAGEDAQAPGQPDRLERQPAVAEGARPADACLFIYLAGGPSQFEPFDPKPHAPRRIRGPWGAIATQAPGVLLGEMLPQLARQTNRFALLRALNHAHALHNPWPMLTGHLSTRISLTAAACHLGRERDRDLPGFVNLGPKLSVGAGALGAACEPLEIPDPTRPLPALPEFVLAPGLTPARLAGRTGLLRDLDPLRRALAVEGRDTAYNRERERALSLLSAARVRQAFDLDAEPDTTRDHYGANSFGQSCLLARRLLEAGVRLVQINWANREDGFAVGWDVHGDDQAALVRMEQQLCPRFDLGLAALLEDLDQRGLLDRTLVVVTGEFGRTPHISRLGGRDHWPWCFSALLAGGGIRGGTVVGASDQHGGQPADRPVTPADFAATLFDRLGVAPHRDDRLRPMVFEGSPVTELWGGTS